MQKNWPESFFTNIHALNESTGICILINSFTEGGAEKALSSLYPEFVGYFSNLSLVCLEKDDVFKVQDAEIKYFSDQPGHKTGSFGKLISLFSLARKLKKFVASNSISVVQSHLYRANYVNVLSRMFGSSHKAQIVNHGMPSQYSKDGLKGFINRFLIKWLYPKADQVICPSRGMADELTGFNVSSDRITIIQNPVDLAEIDRLAKTDVQEAAFQFDPAKRYLISVGRFEAVKRMMDVVEAFNKVAREIKDVDLILLGNGSQEEEILALAKQHGLADRVHLPGHQENPYQFLARSNALISASETEGFSIVLIEALALGIPVISTDCRSGPREILAPGTEPGALPIADRIEQAEFGLLVPVGDTGLMAEAMSKLLTGGVDERLVASGRRRAGHFDKTRVAQNYRTAIEILQSG